MSPPEIEAFADGADLLLAGRRAFRPAAFSLFETWKDAQSFARSAVGRDLLPIVQIMGSAGSVVRRTRLPRLHTFPSTVLDISGLRAELLSLLDAHR